MGDDIAALLRRAGQAGLWGGAEALVARGPRLLAHVAAGTDAAGRALAPGRAVWDVASLTKPLATASLALALGLPPDAPLAEFVPEYRAAPGVSLRDLAAHRAGFAADFRFIDTADDPAGARARLLTLRPERPPRQQVVYSCIGYLLLGLAVERAGGAGLDALFHRHVAAPLGLADSGYLPLARGIDPARIMPTGIRRHNAGRPGLVHDSTAHAFGGVAGNAGLFASAPDLWRFGQALLAGEVGFDTAEMFANLSPAGQVPRSFGWELKAAGAPAPSIGPDFPDGAIGHTGYTGTMMWLDPKTGLIAILLSNRTLRGHRAGLAEMAALRRDFGRLAWRLAGGAAPWPAA